MIKSYYLDGTNKKAFVLENGTGKKIMFTYARPAVYIESETAEPVRIWNNFRINSGKHILKFNKSLTKKIWENMEVKQSPCIGKFVIDGKTAAVEAKFEKFTVLIINGETILVKSGNNIWRINDSKFYKRYSEYINAFLGKEISKDDWNNFEIKSDITF